MTTTVTVKACCATNVEVVVSVTGQADSVLQNGEETTTYAYDLRMVGVKERPRAVAPQPAVDAPIA